MYIVGDEEMDGRGGVAVYVPLVFCLTPFSIPFCNVCT